MTTWHKGPPPSIGWWPAGISRDRDAIRWWNGAWWSRVARPWMTEERAEFVAKLKSRVDNIEWADRPASWPERSKT